MGQRDSATPPLGLRVVEHDAGRTEIFFPTEPLSIVFGVNVLVLGANGLIAIAGAVMEIAMGGDPIARTGPVGWVIAIIFAPLGVLMGAVLALTRPSCLVSSKRLARRRYLRFTKIWWELDDSELLGILIDHATWGTGSNDTLFARVAQGRLDLLEKKIGPFGKSAATEGLGVVTDIDLGKVALAQFLAAEGQVPFAVLEHTISEPSD